jgi:hypothetical protein
VVEVETDRRFDVFLDCVLKLTIDGTATTIPKGQIEEMDVKLHPWGFDAEVAFWISSERAKDTLFASFVKKKLITVHLTVSPSLKDSKGDKIALQGLVTEKSLREETVTAAQGFPVKYRRYVIRFSDPARVLWRQHRPNDLFVDSTFQAVVDAHKGDKITIATSEWDVATKQFPVHFVGLGADPHGASFYDLVAWFVDSQDGVWVYDSAANSYKLVGTKPAATGSPAKLMPTEVASWEVVFPETPRFKVNVQNSDSATSATNEIANEEAATVMRRDYLVRTTIAKDVTDRVSLETSRLILREPDVDVQLGAYPNHAFLPGTSVDFSHSSFGTDIFPSGKTYRVRDVRFNARTTADSVRLETTTATQGLQAVMGLRLELQDEKYVSLPEYVTPTYPVRVEGTVVSEQGKDDEETYQFYTDQDTSVDQYKVKIPLWAEKIVVAPYEPEGYSSHVYFPLIKKERVLVALSFRAARIERTLDWRSGARLPQDSQGDHIIFGKKAADQTSISHAYENALPVLTVKRTKEKDTETIEIRDGRIRLHTEEEK